jgi:molybdate transport system substrate-binding protein
MFSRLFRAVAVCAVFLSFAAPARAGELYAYVGAGLRPPVEALIAAFQTETGVSVRAEYGGSGQLLARWEESRRGDLFILGSAFFTDKPAASGEVEYLQILAVHGPVLAVHPGKADKIAGFADLAQPGVRVGLGDPQAMALGRTAEQILDRSGIGDAVRKNVVARAATVKQLTLYVSDGAVDAAIIGAADAAQNPGGLKFIPLPTAWFDAEYVPAAVLKTATDPASARRFVDFLASEKGLQTFERFGFPRAPKP